MKDRKRFLSFFSGGKMSFREELKLFMLGLMMLAALYGLLFLQLRTEEKNFERYYISHDVSFCSPSSLEEMCRNRNVSILFFRRDCVSCRELLREMSRLHLYDSFREICFYEITERSDLGSFSTVLKTVPSLISWNDGWTVITGSGEIERELKNENNG